MADKSVGELVAAKSVTPTDLFVLEQNGTAKKLTGQILENWLVSFADGHGGIQSIVKKSTSGLVDTYRITLADTTTFDFVVTNGRDVRSITKTGTNGLVDTYTIRYNDNTTDTITVTNGAKGDKGDSQFVWIKYASQKPTATSHSFGDVADNWIGIYSGASATAPTDWTQYEWFQWKGEKGDTGEPANRLSVAYAYQVGDTGNVIPSGTWQTTIPNVPQGKFLWIRKTTTWNSGDPDVDYSISRMGLDGSGSVSSVADISPDENGNVPLTAEHIGALPNTGGDMAGAINMNGQKIKGLNAPTEDDEPATKGYAVAKERVVNNFTTTEEGFVADARALKTLNDSKLSMELLWENASPESGFSAQNISLNLSPYSFIEIYCADAYVFRIDMSKASTAYLSYITNWETGGMFISRKVVLLMDSINFYGAYSYDTGNKSWGSVDGLCKPLRIYGIK